MNKLLKIGNIIFVFILICNFSIVEAKFKEGWENAQLGSYIPIVEPRRIEPGLIDGDEGVWVVNDSAGNKENVCGRTPNRAEIISHNGSKALKLISVSNNCAAENIWASLQEIRQENINIGFEIPLTKDTFISFEESGFIKELINSNAFPSNSCIAPPCFGVVYLGIGDNHGNRLAYILQWESRANPLDTNKSIPNYREIFLNSNNGFYQRNLFDDFNTIPTFIENNAEITITIFEAKNAGWGIIDNLSIGGKVNSPGNGKNNPPDDGTKSFTFNCNNDLTNGPLDLEILFMELANNETCTLKLTNLEPGPAIEIGTNLRSGLRSSIKVEPEFGITDINGEVNFTIIALKKGIDWISWAIPNNKGEFEFNKQAYDNGTAWGMFVDVR